MSASCKAPAPAPASSHSHPPPALCLLPLPLRQPLLLLPLPLLLLSELLLAGSLLLGFPAEGAPGAAEAAESVGAARLRVQQASTVHQALRQRPEPTQDGSASLVGPAAAGRRRRRHSPALLLPRPPHGLIIVWLGWIILLPGDNNYCKRQVNFDHVQAGQTCPSWRGHLTTPAATAALAAWRSVSVSFSGQPASLPQLT